MELTLVEKRRFPRIVLKSPLQYRVRGMGESRSSLCEDISVGGLGFTDYRFVPPHTCVMLELNMLTKAMYPVGKVAWVNHIPHTDRYRFGIEFVEMDRDAKNFLGDYVDMRMGKF